MTPGPDVVTAKDTGATFTPAPEGQHLAVAVDVINLGEKMESYMGQAAKAVPKVAIVYQIDETNPDTGKRFEIAVEKTLAMGQTAGLRKWLGNWRGKQYSDEEARNTGAPLHKLVGVQCLLTVEHKTSKNGRLYAFASNISPKPRAMTGDILALDYSRPDYWTKRKEEYAASLAPKAAAGGEHDYPPPHEDEGDDSDLPF